MVDMAKFGEDHYKIGNLLYRQRRLDTTTRRKNWKKRKERDLELEYKNIVRNLLLRNIK